MIVENGTNQRIPTSNSKGIGPNCLKGSTFKKLNFKNFVPDLIFKTQGTNTRRK